MGNKCFCGFELFFGGGFGLVIKGHSRIWGANSLVHDRFNI
jgi:hypothetical protein